VVVDAACAAIFQQTIVRQTRRCLAGISTTWFKVVHSSDGGGLAGVGVPDENRFRSCGASFNPARALLHVPFYWKGDLVPRSRRERNHQPPEPLLPQLVPPCGGRANPFRAARAGRRIYAGFGATSAFQSRSRVSTRFPFISKGEFVFLIRREQNHRTTGFRPAVVDATCCSLVAMHPRRTQGWDAESTSFGSFRFYPGRTQRPLLVSVRIHHVRSPVVKALSIP